MKYPLALLFSGVLLASASAAGQFSVNLGGQVTLPQGEFQEQTDTWLPGFAINGGYRFAGTPLWLGAEMNFAWMGSNLRQVPWSSTIPDVFLDVRTEHSAVQLLALARIMPLQGAFQPYGEAMIGPQIFSSTTTVSSPNANNGEPIAEQDVHTDSSLAYGFGLGAAVTLLPSSGPDDPGIGLFLSWRWLTGSEAEYLTHESVIQDGNDISYEPKTSRTDQQQVQLGVSISF